MDIGEYLAKTINMYFGKVEEGYNYVNKNVGLWDSIIVYYFLVLISMVITTLTDINTYTQFGSSIAILIVGTIILSLVILPLGILIGYGLIHLFLMMFGGKATFSETIKFSIAASIFSAIIGTLTSAVTNILISNVQDAAMTIAYSIVMFFISLAIGIWALIIMVRTLSLAHNLSMGKTFLAIIMPILIILFVLFIIGFIIAIAIGMSAF